MSAGNGKTRLGFVAKSAKALACLGLVVFASQCSQRAVTSNSTEIPNSPDFYPEVVSACDGDPVVVRGYIDIKGICWDHETTPDQDSCETAIFRRCPYAYMPIRIEYCSVFTTSNCVIRLPKTDDYHKSDIRDIFRDEDGQSVPPAAEVEISFVVGANQSDGKFVKDITSIKVIPGSFDQVNVNCCSTP